MLSITDLSYRIGGRALFESATLNITDGWKVGVVGPNGAGKSTLFKLISGELVPDGGKVSLTGKQRLGIVRQDAPETDMPLVELVLSANEEMAGLWKEAETELDPQRLSDIFQRLSDMDAYSAPAKAATLLTGLGFREDQLNEPFSSFSGGWRMRVMLASALFMEPEVLLLDEPTNHLDLEAIMWLEGYLSTYPHTLLVISHDRALLNTCVDHIVHVEPQKLTVYTGNYDTFERERTARLGLQQKMFEKQQAQRAHMQAFVDRFKAKASKARQAQSRVKALERMDLVDAVIADRAVQFKFPDPEKLPSPMISMQKVDIGYQEGKPILKGIRENIDADDRIALLGANGNGKSTMMKLIADRLGIMDGEVFRLGKLKIGYFSQHQTDELDVDSTPYSELGHLMRKQNPDVKEPSIRAKLGQFNFTRDMMDNRISNLSGGEKARLLFCFMSIDNPHLLLLDEPTNHLDMESREALVQALNAYEGAVVIVSHDPVMIERVADRLWLIHEGKCQAFDGDLEDYRKFIIDSKREAKRAERLQREKDAQQKTPEQEVVVTTTEASSSKSSVSKHSLGKLEKEMEKLSEQRRKLENKMADPKFYEKPNEMLKIQKEYDLVSKQLEEIEEKLLTLY